MNFSSGQPRKPWVVAEHRGVWRKPLRRKDSQPGRDWDTHRWLTQSDDPITGTASYAGMTSRGFRTLRLLSLPRIQKRLQQDRGGGAVHQVLLLRTSPARFQQ